MRFLAGAQPCGFGPVSKLVALASLLDRREVAFVGTGVAMDFADLNRHYFASLHRIDTADGDRLGPLLRSSDTVVSVMDAELVFWAARAGRTVFFFDSLLSFWRLDRSIGDLVEVAEVVRGGPQELARKRFDDLGAHERIALCHLLADRSYAQNFPGVAERVEEFRRFGHSTVELCGPIIDFSALHDAVTNPDPATPDVDVILNLGGFKNFLLDYDHNNAYLLLMQRWVVDLLRDWPRFRRIAVYCGAFRVPQSVTVGRSQAWLGRLRLPEFLQVMVRVPHYMAPPGLTSLLEAVASGRLPMALPEQHFNHISNLRMMRGTRFESHAATLSWVLPGHAFPEDDLAGSRAIVQAAEAIVDDQDLYRQFRRYMNERVERYVHMSPADREAALDELRPILRGPSISEVVGGLLSGQALVPADRGEGAWIETPPNAH